MPSLDEQYKALFKLGDGVLQAMHAGNEHDFQGAVFAVQHRLGELMPAASDASRRGGPADAEYSTLLLHVGRHVQDLIADFSSDMQWRAGLDRLSEIGYIVRRFQLRLYPDSRRAATRTSTYERLRDEPSAAAGSVAIHISTDDAVVVERVAAAARNVMTVLGYAAVEGYTVEPM